MTRFRALILAASFAIGGIGLIGCDSNTPTENDTDRPGFAGGNGAFGESPAVAGTYSNTGRSAQPAAAHQPGAGTTGESSDSSGK